MGFRGIGDFLSRFSKILPSDRIVRALVIDAARECAGIALKESEIAVRGGTVYLLADPRVRSEVLLAKGCILRALKGSPVRVDEIR